MEFRTNNFKNINLIKIVEFDFFKILILEINYNNMIPVSIPRSFCFHFRPNIKKIESFVGININ